jgi:hypothetical protein
MASYDRRYPQPARPPNLRPRMQPVPSIRLSAKLQQTPPTLQRFKAALMQTYGDRIDRIVHFGSRARADRMLSSQEVCDSLSEPGRGRHFWQLPWGFIWARAGRPVIGQPDSSILLLTTFSRTEFPERGLGLGLARRLADIPQHLLGDQLLCTRLSTRPAFGWQPVQYH